MRPLLNVRDLTIEFPQSRAGQAPSSTQPGGTAAPVAAVRSLSFSIAPGEVLGLVGESGSGKSITSLAIMGLLPPAAIVTGEITFQNGDGPPTHLTTLPSDQLRQLRGSRMAMIFQEPMTALNPVMRVGDQIAEAVLAHHHVSKSEAWRQAVEGMRDVAIAEVDEIELFPAADRGAVGDQGLRTGALGADVHRVGVCPQADHPAVFQMHREVAWTRPA